MAERISVVGLGKLGLCLAACFAERGFETIGVDIEQGVVDAVNEGRAPWYEPRLDELLALHGGQRLRATVHHKEAIEQTDVTVLLVATPSNSDGSFSNRFLQAALRSLAEALNESGKEHHQFVISSTVMPESTNSVFIPLIEKHSERKLNHGFSVCYDPDFVALGNVINGFLRPDLVVIGESNPNAGDRLEAIHRQLCENQPSISRMSIVSAEIAKVCLNAYITVKISFANSVANLCEKISGADVDAITNAIGADKRISPYYFQGGLAFGGTCFPRDTRAYISLAEKHQIHPALIHAVNRINKFQDEHLADVVLKELQTLNSKTVGILGLAFTGNTPVATESPSVKLMTKLLEYDVRIVAYDRLAIDSARSIFGSAVEYVNSVETCLHKADLAIFTLRDPQLKYEAEAFVPHKPLTIIDGWRFINPLQLDQHIRYVPLGRYQ